MNRATVNKIFQKHPVYVKAGMIAVISIIIFGCVYSKDNGKKLEKDEKGREILRRNESGKDELKNMKVKIDEKQEDISISVSGKKYDEEELKNAFSEAEKEVEQAVLGKNKSLDEVRSDLNLITSVPEKNMKVSWELDRYDVMDIQGHLQQDNLSTEGTLIKGEEIRQVEETILDEFEEIKSSGQSENEGADEEETESEDLAELEENPFQCLEQIERTGILSVAMPKDMPLSGRQIDLDLQASKRSLQTGRGKFPMRKNTDKAKEKLLFNEYIMQNFTQASKENISEYPDSDEKNRSLDYEIEYIISGKSSDKENLESVVTKIFFIRMALNYVYLMGDSVKKSEAMALAATISTLLLIPEAAEAVKQLILLAWAAGEGVIDIRSLLSGNKVPLVKTSDNWQLTLASLFTLGIGDDGISGADAEEGITYKEYLRAFLFLQPEEETTMRTIDRIEENMRLEQNCEKFRADHCVTKCEIRNKVEIFGDLAYTFPSYYGYE